MQYRTVGTEGLPSESNSSSVFVFPKHETLNCLFLNGPEFDQCINLFFFLFLCYVDTNACKTYHTITIYNRPPEDEPSGSKCLEDIKKLKIKTLI